MSEIKAIETEYNGILFRSRLEARWAVFFDAAGVKYEYEPYSFMLDGIGYVPDFYLPDYELYVEAKPAREGAVIEVAKTLGLIGTGKIKHLMVLSNLPEGVNASPSYPIVYMHPFTKDIVYEWFYLWKGRKNRFTFTSGQRYYDIDSATEKDFLSPNSLDHGGTLRECDLHECFTRAKAYRFD